MGISIYLDISKSVTQKEWEKVYEETLVLVKRLPFAERRSIKIHGIDIICLVPTEEREESYGWYDEKKRTGWCTSGDYVFMDTAEDYYVPRKLVKDEKIEPDAGDAIMGTISGCLDISWEDERCSHTYDLWGGKTQGEQYHMYILAVACLIEARLGNRAYTYGDITRGQCKRAVEIANQYLKNPIEMPDRCYPDRLMKRVAALPLSDKEKLSVFEYSYLGTKDAEFGECMRKYFNEKTLDAYWKERMRRFEISMNGFHGLFNEYMLMGFDLEQLCGYVKMQDKDGVDRHAEFIIRVLDAKLHFKDKNCADILEIDQEEEGTYSIWTLMAQFGFAGARNKKVDRYIPIEEIRRALNAGLRDFSDVDQIIDEYLDKEAAQTKINLEEAFSSEEKLAEAVNQDASDIFNQVMEKKREALEKMQEKYDISDQEDLMFYETGDTMHPVLEEAIGKSRCFLDSILEEERFAELMAEDAHARCRWIVKQNQSFLIRDKDWEKVFSDIEDHKASFGRYYSLLRVKMDSSGLVKMCTAFMVNDALYAYSKTLADQISEEKENIADEASKSD